MNFRIFAALFFSCTLLFQQGGLAQEKSKQEHDQMRTEHKTALSEHQAWAVKVGKLKADHSKALAALAQLRAEILAHDAELDAISNHIMQHELEMKSHDGAMHAHDKGGDGHQHNDMKSTHDKIMKQHQSLGQQLEAESKHHGDLISGILTFAKKHSKAFHMHEDHEGEGSGNNHDHDHDHDHDHK